MAITRSNIGQQIMKTPSKKQPKLGTGKRFENLTKSIAAKGNVKDPAAVAAAIGRKKYGAKKMAQLSATARKKNARRP
jgi:hypothetical protein